MQPKLVLSATVKSNEKHLLSKSSFMKGMQCEKALYLYKHHYALRDPIPQEREAMFERGNRIGLLARDLFPGGVDATPKSIKQYAKAVNQTQQWIREGKKVIYEAAFQHKQVLAAIDILVEDEGKWKAYEVKSSARVSRAHILDAALQYYVIKGSGVPLDDISIVHINTSYRLEGELNLKNLFSIRSVKKKVQEYQQEIADKIEGLKEVLDLPAIPEKEIGMHCFDPYPCDFMGYCWKHVPENSIFNLHGIHKEKAFELYNKGVQTIGQVPKQNPLNDAQNIQVKARQTGQTTIDSQALNTFLDDFQFPLLFADFESMQPPVPLFQGSKPYQQIPFQFSIHQLDTPTSELEHREFLADHATDPRRPFIENFLEQTQGKGSIVVYNQAFESMILKYLKGVFPEYENDIDDRLFRLVDLMIPFKNKYYYVPAMQGSHSIKKVLPALVPDLSYETLSIANGHMASAAYESLRNPTELFQEEETKEALLRYCEMDTLAMVEIYQKLAQAASEN